MDIWQQAHEGNRKGRVARTVLAIARELSLRPGRAGKGLVVIGWDRSAWLQSIWRSRQSIIDAVAWR